MGFGFVYSKRKCALVGGFWFGHDQVEQLNRFKTSVYPLSHDFLNNLFFFFGFRYKKILKEIQEILGKC